MPHDLDRYYTPAEVARSALERATLAGSPSVCADTTCGTGRLLNAANEVFGAVQCVGIDRDSNAIAALRKRNATSAQIAKYASDARVWKAMEPYVSVLTSDG